ncbi:membrane-associated progesterone binding protein 4 isoform X3 [Wolffia australiana]
MALAGATTILRGGWFDVICSRDASRAFVSGNFTGDGLTDSLHGLSSVEIKSVVDWRNFYLRTYVWRQRYRFRRLPPLSKDRHCGNLFVGKLVGRYYDKSGKPTKYLKGVEAKAARGAQLLEKQKQEESKLPNCNSRWNDKDGGEVWCDVGYPRMIQRPFEIALTGRMSKRCVCLRKEELHMPGLEVYEGCDPLSNSCRV